MRVPYETIGNTSLTQVASPYYKAPHADFSALAQGLQNLGEALTLRQKKTKEQADQVARFRATADFTDFSMNAGQRAEEWAKQADPADTTLADRVGADFHNYKEQFIQGLPKDLQEEFRMRAEVVGKTLETNAHDTQVKRLDEFQRNRIGQQQNNSLSTITTDPNTLEGQKSLIDEMIDKSSLSETEKYYLKQSNAALLEKEGYKSTLHQQAVRNTSYMGELVSSVRMGAKELGASAQDLLTVMSYETGGTFSTDQTGGTNGAHLGLIQFGPAEQKKYGVTKGMSPTEQMQAVVSYMKDRGFKPGMGLMDMYSIINAGAPGKYNASDAANGGAPGSVADKVNTMGAHADKAAKLLNMPRIAMIAQNEPGRQPVNVTGLNPNLVSSWEVVQGQFGRALPVVSGVRDAAVNAAAGGAKNSEHLRNDAIDISVKDLSIDERKKLVQLASASGFTGIGFYANSIHLDMRPTGPAVWGPTHSRDSLPAWAYQIAHDHLAGKFGGPGQSLDQQFRTHQANAAQMMVGRYRMPDTLDNDPRFSNVPFEDRIAIRQGMQAEVTRLVNETQQQLDDARKNRVNDLYNGLLSGNYDMADINQAIKDGDMPSYDERKKALDILSTRNKQSDLLTSAQQKLASGAFFDYKDAEDKKYLNTLFGSEGMTHLSNRNESYVTDKLAPFYKQTGALPPDAIALFDTLSRSNDMRNVTYALQSLNVLENVNPTAFAAQVPDNLKRKADLFATLNGNVSQEQLNMMLADAPTQELRTSHEYFTKQAETLLSPSNPQGVKFADQTSGIGGSVDSSSYAVAQNEWNTLFTQYYAQTQGNKDAAVMLANKQFSRVWKTTQIDGANTLMKFPPEAVYQPIAGSFDWITQQLRGELGLKPDEHALLISDRQTAADIQAGKPASYLVAIKNADGVIEMKTGEKGLIRQYFKPTEADKATHELDLRIKSKQIELESYMKLLSVGAGQTSINGVPSTLLEDAHKVTVELQQLQSQKTDVQQKQEDFYNYPAQKKIDALQQQMNELASSTVTYDPMGIPTGYTDTADEMHALMQQMDAAKAELEAQKAARRGGK